MKKLFGFILKLTAICMALSAAVFAVVAYWDKITEFFFWAKSRLTDKRICCCHSSEFEDYADWDD